MDPGLLYRYDHVPVTVKSSIYEEYDPIMVKAIKVLEPNFSLSNEYQKFSTQDSFIQYAVQTGEIVKSNLNNICSIDYDTSEDDSLNIYTNDEEPRSFKGNIDMFLGLVMLCQPKKFHPYKFRTLPSVDSGTKYGQGWYKLSIDL